MHKDHIKHLIGAMGLTLIFSMIISAIILVPKLLPNLSRETFPKPENLTELYFEDHLELPKNSSPGAEISFNYVVHNVEHASMTYPVNIYVNTDENPPNSTLVAQDNFTLKSNETKTFTGSFTYPQVSTQRSKIVVELMSLDQSINFWVNIPPIATQSAQLDLVTK